MMQMRVSVFVDVPLYQSFCAAASAFETDLLPVSQRCAVFLAAHRRSQARHNYVDAAYGKWERGLSLYVKESKTVRVQRALVSRNPIGSYFAVSETG